MTLVGALLFDGLFELLNWSVVDLRHILDVFEFIRWLLFDRNPFNDTSFQRNLACQ